MYWAQVQAVSVLAFYSVDLSSNTSEVPSFDVNLLEKRSKINEKETVVCARYLHIFAIGKMRHR